MSTGLSSLGYSYINIDDCWQADTRDADGRLQANSTRFPSGMEALGEYIHSKGLKFGLYSSAGFKTCQGYPASLGMILKFVACIIWIELRVLSYLHQDSKILMQRRSYHGE